MGEAHANEEAGRQDEDNEQDQEEHYEEDHNGESGRGEGPEQKYESEHDYEAPSWRRDSHRLCSGWVPAREGEIVQVVQGDVSVSYRVKWADGHDTLITPGAGTARVVPKGSAHRP